MIEMLPSSAIKVMTVTGLVTASMFPLATQLPDNETPAVVCLTLVLLALIAAGGYAMSRVSAAINKIADTNAEQVKRQQENNDLQREANKRLDELCMKISQSPCIMKDPNTVRTIADHVSHEIRLHTHCRDADV